MRVLANSQHEAFAQARFAGKTITEAHYAAGFAGDKASASRLNRQHEVQERIAELFREAVAKTAYEKTDAIRDLLAEIRRNGRPGASPLRPSTLNRSPPQSLSEGDSPGGEFPLQQRVHRNSFPNSASELRRAELQ